MNRAQLEHVIRAASGVTGVPDLVVIGSQAVLGPFPDAPPELCASMEADVFPRGRPDLAIQIDGAIGERSLFHETFGYYAHGVGEDTAILPAGWEKRLVAVHNENTGGATGWCLEIHDLAVSKLVAGRQKDLAFLAVVLRNGLADPPLVRQRLDHTDLPPDRRQDALLRWKRLHP